MEAKLAWNGPRPSDELVPRRMGMRSAYVVMGTSDLGRTYGADAANQIGTPTTNVDSLCPPGVETSRIPHSSIEERWAGTPGPHARQVMLHSKHED
jgi:hypothetical protein